MDLEIYIFSRGLELLVACEDFHGCRWLHAHVDTRTAIISEIKH